jgi:hypothetical protein
MWLLPWIFLGACGGGESGLVCKQPAAASCYPTGDPYCSWQGATAHGDSTTYFNTCGPYYSMFVGGVGTDTVYYYDVSTGLLVAIVLHQGFDASQPTTQCLAGPSRFTEPTPCP